MFPEIPLFPTDSVAISLTTTVWVGVMVTAFFNLRLGWSIAGLTVPGYLVPLLMFKPTSAVIIVCEAILTFWLVYAISEAPRRTRFWCSFFGRDRFLALVIGSVVVRALLEGWILPRLGPHLNEFTGWQIDYRNDLHSYGLIIVSLIANYFWKPGVIRGGAALATTMLITSLIVRFGLVEFTNLNVSDIANLYEDISASLLASPKAYIVILTAALVSSWLNLKYSWDYNGILVPSLFALWWFDPTKVFVSFVEAGAVLGLAVLILKLPTFKKVNVEGARRTALFFTICFLYRLTICHAVQKFCPSLHITDLFGFGYLLTTLLAIKAHQKQLTGRIVKFTVQASTLGAVVGNLFGFGLTFLPADWLSPVPEHAWANPSYAVRRTDQSLLHELRQDKLLLYRQKSPGSYKMPLIGEISHFRKGIRLLHRYVDTGQPRDLDAARARLRAANYTVSLVRDRYIYVREREVDSSRGWGAYVFDTRSSSQLIVGVPRPLDEGTLESGLCLFQELDAAVLAVGGTVFDPTTDVLNDRRSMFANLHAELPKYGVFHVRGFAKETEPSLDDESAKSSVLWVHQDLPANLDLNLIHSLSSSYEIRWGDTPAKNQVREEAKSGFAELWISRNDRRSFHARLFSADPVMQNASVQYVQGPLYPRLMEIRNAMAKKHSELYKAPSLAELLLLDDEVLQPLIRLVTNWNDDLPKQPLAEIATSASILGYRIEFVDDPIRQQEFVVLRESPGSDRYWGTFVFRKAPWSNNIIEVPRPLAERQAFEFGASLFGQLDACALFVGGSHPLANRDGSSDLARLSNKSNPLQLVHQAYLRDTGDRPLLVIQSRSIRSPVQSDVVMACADGASGLDLSALQKRALDSLGDMGLSVSVVRGEEVTAGYEVNILLQSASLNQSENKEMVSLWVSPTLRNHYQALESQVQLKGQFETLDIQLVADDLFAFLDSQRRTKGGNQTQPAPPRKLQSSVSRYLESRDIVQLAAIQRSFPQYWLSRVEDISSGQLFLVFNHPDGMPAIVNVTGSVGEYGRTVKAEPSDISAVHTYTKTRATWLVFEGGKP